MPPSRGSAIIRLLGLLLATLLIARAAAQEEPSLTTSAGKFACSSGAHLDSPFDPYSALVLKPLPQRPSDIPRNVTTSDFGPFDESHYGFQRAEFHQFLTGYPETATVSTETVLHIYLRMITGRNESWFDLQPGDNSRMNADPSSEEVEGSSADRRPKSNHAAAEMTQPDPALPIFQISWSARWTGANASGTQEEVAVLDLRRQPAVVRNLDCINGEGGGVCGEHDSAWAPDLALDCSWQKDALDYACHSVESRETTWGVRTLESDFYLFSRKDAYKPPANAPDTLSSFVNSLTPGRGLNQHGLITDVGDVEVIYSVREPARVLDLLAARGRGDSLDARFFLAEQPFNDRPVGAVEIKPASASALPTLGFADLDIQQQHEHNPQPVVTARAGGAPLSFQVRQLWTKKDFTILAVNVKEDGHHSLYWIGIDERRNPTVADALRIATDGHPYHQCNTYRVESSAASATVAPGATFHATLDMEPERVESEEGMTVADDDEKPAPACIRRLSWDRGKGFVFAEAQTCKLAPPRDITINDDGAIVAKPSAAPGNK